MMLSGKLSVPIIVFLCVLCATAVFAQQATGRATTGRLVEVKVAAPGLKGNLLNDPTEQSVAVYLPPSYDTSPAKRFPTLYLLHGFRGNNKAWTTNGYQGMSLQPLMDEMIKSGKIREMIVVAPNGWNAYGGAFYTNSSVTGNWEDYFYPEHAPFYVDFPYQERDGRLEKNETVYARWRSKMPLYMVDDNKENLLKLRGIFMDYSQKEEFSHIRITSQLFSKALAERSIPHIFEIYEGADHGNRIRQRVETRVLQFFSNRLEYVAK